MSIVASTPTSVYRYYDSSDLLLYVGITSRRARRQLEHNGDKEWWPFVARQEVEHYDSREEAMAREKSLIRLHHSPFNVQHNPMHAEMRALYLATAGAGGIALTRNRAVQTLGQIRHRLPLAHVRSTDNLLLLASRMEHTSLVGCLDLGQRPALLAPKRVGTLISIRRMGGAHLFEFGVNQRLRPADYEAHIRVGAKPAMPYVFAVKKVDA